MLTTRRAFSLIEVLIVCAIIGVITGISVPRIRTSIDGFAVEGAARDVAGAFAFARLAAQRHGGAEVRLDTLSVSVRAAGTMVHARDIARTHGVRMRTNTALIRYAATGLAVGVGNGSIILSRGTRVDTVVISRLGRVRR